MKHSFRILVINPKVSSTVIGLFHDDICLFKKTITHPDDKIKHDYSDNHVSYRKKAIIDTLFETDINFSKLDAVCARGGLLKPIKGGTYKVTEQMLIDLKRGYNGVHVSNLGGIIADSIAKQLNINAYIVDPVVVDELQDVARVSGFPGIERKSIFHALNHKAVARKVASELNKPYSHTKLIVVHMGDGITIGAHENGKVVDVNNGLHGDGPFSLTRAGALPTEGLIKMCFQNKQTSAQTLIKKMITKGGLNAYLDTSSIEEIEDRIANGDAFAQHIYEAMIYQISKEIGAMSTVLWGQVDGIIITGNLAYQSALVNKLVKRIKWIADVFIYPGENDLQALNEGTLRVLNMEEKPKVYPVIDTNKGEEAYDQRI